jgi:sphingolipid 4-desaturase/C4-monooxygenase
MNTGAMCTHDDIPPTANAKPPVASEQQKKPLAVCKQQNFTVVDTEEPHKLRRKAILQKHPEIKQLFGPDIRLLPCILAIVTAQLSLALLTVQWPFWQWLLAAYALGGTLTHWLSLGNHELSHNLCFKSTFANELLGMVANLAQGIPSSQTFKKYHLEHHYCQGDDAIDMDLPTEWEGRFFTNAALKVLWVILQPAFYALRPVCMNPKPYTAKEALNFIAVISFDVALCYFVGYKALLFNLISTLLGMGLHPVAGHFIAEHYTLAGVETNQETFSYYGPLNYVTFFVGYHNEHHDFPRVSGFKLAQVKALAPEFYDNLHSYDSWCGVIYDYIMRPDIGPFSRVTRPTKKNE